MKKLIKILAIIMSVTMLTMLFASCAKKEQNALEKIKAAGKIVWGTNAEFVPFEMKDASGNVIGVDAKVAQAIADKLGVELVVEDILFDSLPAALESGKIDYIGAGYTIKPERQETMDFTDTYYKAVQVVVVNEVNTTITGSADTLKGLKIGVQNGTSGDWLAQDVENADVQRYDSMLLAAQDLKNGRVDCVIGDNLTMSLIMESLGGLKVADLPAYEDEYYAYAVKKGESELLAVINEVVKELIANGQIEKWSVELS